MAHDLVWCDDLEWFLPVRQTLCRQWLRADLGEYEAAGGEFPCAQLFAETLDLNKGHVSIACSLLDDYGQVTKLLASSSFDSDTILFFRLLLFLLHELTERIRDCYRLLGESNPKRKPESISLWANRYAKHKLAFFVHHHARHVFADGNPGMYNYLQKDRETAIACLRSGSLPEAVITLDDQWLKANPEADYSVANQPAIAAILVPPFASFVDDVVDYLNAFLAFAKGRPEELGKFQSSYHWPVTEEMETEIREMFVDSGSRS